MKTSSGKLGSTVWRLLASWMVLLGIVEVGKRVPYLDLSGTRTRPAEETPTNPREHAPDQASPVSILEMAGVPMAMTTRVVFRCDARVWSPRDMPEWTPGSWLLELERSDDQVTATWLEIDEGAVHHSAQLDCPPAGQGALHHTWIQAGAGGGGREVASGGSPAADQDPVPLLSDCVRRLRFQSLGWRIFVDEPGDVLSVLARFQAVMSAQGWRRQDLPSPALAAATGEIVAGQGLDEVILRREGALCLVKRVQIEGREMLVTACLGLAAPESSRLGGPMLAALRSRSGGNLPGGRR